MKLPRACYRLALVATLAAAIVSTKSAYASDIKQYQIPVPQSALQTSRAEAPIQLAQSCGWFVIVACAKSRRSAAKASYGARVLRTNDYPNFRNGWYCGFDGPFSSRGAAKQRRLGWLEASPDAYVKKGC